MFMSRITLVMWANTVPQEEGCGVIQSKGQHDSQDQGGAPQYLQKLLTGVHAFTSNYYGSEEIKPCIAGQGNSKCFLIWEVFLVYQAQTAVFTLCNA